uniref:RNA-binding S4 domain-containing protein n=1 Tax=Oryza glumipatula TaxID=40148 RepID=A0A0D9Z271_9ORYZ
MALAAAAAAAAAAVSFPPLLSRPAACVLLRCGRHRRLPPLLLRAASSSTSSAPDFNITFAEPTASAPSKPKPSSPAPSAEQVVPWIVRGEDGKPSMRTAPPPDVLQAIALAEAEAKKAKKDPRRSHKGAAALATPVANAKVRERKAAPATAPPKFSKAARRFYNENIKEHEPQRLAKVLAAAGVASRRTCEELIFQGKVTVNGSVCTAPQTKVDISKDSIYVNGNRISKKLPPKLYFAVNKPKGYICSCGEPKSIISLFDDYLKGWNKIQPGVPKPRLFTVGRLDVATSGLIIITNDGEFAQKLSHPSSNIMKEYVVTIDGPVHRNHLIAISEGTKIDGVKCIPDLVEPLDVQSNTKRTRIRIAVHEGRNHEVRELVQNAGLEVYALKRVRIGRFRLPPDLGLRVSDRGYTLSIYMVVEMGYCQVEGARRVEMNFLYRTSQPVAPELPRIPEQDQQRDSLQKPVTTLEGLIADDPYHPSPEDEDTDNGAVDIGGDSADADSKNSVPTGKHTDVLDDEGWITIPNKELPDNWNDLSDMLQLQPLDRPFLFPENGDSNVKNGENGSQVVEDDMQSVELNSEMSPMTQDDMQNVELDNEMSPSKQDDMQNVELNNEISPSKQDILETESLLRLEDHKQQIESMLQRFKMSNFFVRIAESDEPLWSNKKLAVSKVPEEQSYSDNQENNKGSRSNAYNTISDKGVFDGSTSGGIARGTARCYALQNGDIVVVLQVNVGVNKMEAPVLEVLQFEKSSSSNYITKNLVNGLSSASSTQPPNIRPPPISESQEFVPEKPAKTPDIINDGQLSFRGVPLEPERYSNISPQHVKDIVVLVDAITIVFEEASKGGAPLSLPIASIEVGHGHSLPNLALRRGEEHSFILKPATMSFRDRRTNNDAPLTLSLPKMNGTATNVSLPKVGETIGSLMDQYAVLVSYRCNYTESKLFFKQATSWRPCVASDLMISVSSELSLRNPISSARVPQLPVQVLTLEATNMTSENLTVTVLAPEASGSSSVVSLNSAPTTPNSSYDNLNESVRRSGLGKHRAGFRRMNSVLAGSPKESDNGGNIINTSGGCTHLWLQSAVPLGCIPALSSTTVKLELLPLTDGIITLDTLQITIREKGLTYIPEHSLEIYASAANSTGSS